MENSLPQTMGSGNEFVTEEGLWQSFDSSNRDMDGKFLVLWKKTRKGVFRG